MNGFSFPPRTEFIERSLKNYQAIRLHCTKCGATAPDGPTRVRAFTKRMCTNTPGSEIFATTRIPQGATHRGIRVVARGSDPGVIFINHESCEMTVDAVVRHD